MVSIGRKPFVALCLPLANLTLHFLQLPCRLLFLCGMFFLIPKEGKVWAVVFDWVETL